MKTDPDNTSFFENILLFIGIDVHKSKWAITVRTYDLELKTFSMEPSSEELEKLKEIKFEDKLFDLKFGNLLKEYQYIVDQIKDSEKIIGKIKEDEELGRRISIIEKLCVIKENEK